MTTGAHYASLAQLIAISFGNIICTFRERCRVDEHAAGTTTILTTAEGQRSESCHYCYAACY